MIDAVFEYVVHWFAFVGDVMCTVYVEPAGNVDTKKFNDCEPAAPVTENEPAGDCESIDHVTGNPGFPPGNESENDAPVASPAPVFDTVTVNPIAEPAFTDAASDVFVNVTLGQFTTV